MIPNVSLPRQCHATQCFPSDFPALVADFIPQSLSHLNSPLHILSTQCNNLTDHQLGHTPRITKRTVEHRNSLLGSILQVNLIRADTETSNTNQILGMFQYILT